MKKVILVTGASSGIGQDAALRLIDEGHIVYGAARRLVQMKPIVDRGGHAIEMDVLNELAIDKTIDQIMAEQGRIDVVINNAGYAVWGAVETVSMDDARRQFEVNLFGLASLTKKVIPLMREQKSGKIINLSSMAGRMYTPLGAWYHASKHALEGWSDCLRIELKAFNIHVVLIEPGAIFTEFGSVMLAPMAERAKNSPYEKISASIAEASKQLYEKNNCSPTSVISHLVLKAVRSKKPKRRYVGGKYAKLMLFIRKWLGDTIFEMAIMSQLKTLTKNR